MPLTLRAVHKLQALWLREAWAGREVILLPAEQGVAAPGFPMCLVQ